MAGYKGRAKHEAKFACPRCGSIVPTSRDPFGCSNGHEFAGMVPLPTPGPEWNPIRISSGPLKYAAMTAFILVFASFLAWIWTGEWQWGPTAVTLLFGGIFLREGSLKDVDE